MKLEEAINESAQLQDREIKFRAWAKNIKKMFYSGFEISSEGKIAHTYGIYDKRLILMQYTGLKDKNGVLIYEGDIIKFLDWRPREVIWQIGKRDNAVACFSLNATDLFLAEYDTNKMEVIGNIYEGEK